MVARVIYGFRISVLFGLILTVCRTVIGVVAGAVQGYFGGWLDLFFQRFLEIWGVAADALHPDHPGQRHRAELLVAAGHHAAVQLDLAGRPGARGVPAGPQLRICARGAALGVSNSVIMFRHLLPNAMVATLTFLPFTLGGSVTTLTSARFPRLRAAARLALARASCCSRARTICRRPGSASPASS